MEKLKHYNQIILAIGGTLALAMLFIFGLAAGYQIYDDMWGRDDNQADTRMIANDELERLRADSLRKQVISFWIIATWKNCTSTGSMKNRCRK